MMSSSGSRWIWMITAATNDVCSSDNLAHLPSSRCRERYRSCYPTVLASSALTSDRPTMRSIIAEARPADVCRVTDGWPYGQKLRPKFDLHRWRYITT